MSRLEEQMEFPDGETCQLIVLIKGEGEEDRCLPDQFKTVLTILSLQSFLPVAFDTVGVRERYPLVFQPAFDPASFHPDRNISLDPRTKTVWSVAWDACVAEESGYTACENEYDQSSRQPLFHPDTLSHFDRPFFFSSANN